MTAYVALNCDTELAVTAEDLGAGAGRVPCFECEGRGIWDYMAPEEPPFPCVECKGTGFVLVTIAP